MTYDTAANVSFNYGKTVKLKEPLEERSSELAVVRPGHASINGKIAYAVMVEGNCDAESRNKKVDALKQVLGIDIMGRCGTVKHKECDNRDPYCFEILAKTYYFYVAFENSECPDYITEKVWRNSLEAGMVPIVWSDKVDYKTLLPPHSFINVADFATLQEFADRIKFIVSNPEINFEHLQSWRTTHKVERHFNAPADLCRFAHMHRGQELNPINITSIRQCFTE